MITLALLLQIAVPPPRGYVNDFAGVLDAASVQHMETVIAEVREKTGGEIAVVTLADIGDRAAADVALQIGRQWGVGDSAAAGDSRKNLGVVVLLVPRKNHQLGTAKLYVATGRGAEGFLTDAATGRIDDAMLPALAAEEYGKGLALGVDLIAQTFAKEFGVTLTGIPAAVRTEPEQRDTGIPIGWVLVLAIVLMVVTRGRILWWVLWGLSQSRGGGWGGRGGGWGGGRGGGGFGGFGGGGGFSGGGAGRSF